MVIAVVLGALATSALPSNFSANEPKCPLNVGAPQTTSIRQIAAHPERWDCVIVRVTGVAVRGHEDSYLYETLSDRCRLTGDHPKAIAVDWYRSNATEKRFSRLAEIEGTFRNDYGRKWPPGTIVITPSAPGPLVDVRIVRWLSADLPPCKRH